MIEVVNNCRNTQLFHHKRFVTVFHNATNCRNVLVARNICGCIMPQTTGLSFLQGFVRLNYDTNYSNFLVVRNCGNFNMPQTVLLQKQFGCYMIWDCIVQNTSEISLQEWDCITADNCMWCFFLSP